MKMITAPILGLLVIFGMLPPSCTANQYRNALKSGESLKPTEALIYKEYLFIMQPDCDLVLYKDSTAVWSTGTGGRDHSCSAKLMGGNLVVYSPKGVSLWESSTDRTGSENEEYVLVFEKYYGPVNVAIYGPVRWTVPWPSGDTVPHQWLVSPEQTNIMYPWVPLLWGESLILGSYKCTLQVDCNLVCRNGTIIVWETNTAGKGVGCYLTLANKLVIRDIAGSLVWRTDDFPNGNYVLLMQKSPILAVYGPRLWITYYYYPGSGTASPAAPLLSSVTW